MTHMMRTYDPERAAAWQNQMADELRPSNDLQSAAAEVHKARIEQGLLRVPLAECMGGTSICWCPKCITLANLQTKVRDLNDENARQTALTAHYRERLEDMEARLQDCEVDSRDSFIRKAVIAWAATSTLSRGELWDKAKALWASKPEDC